MVTAAQQPLTPYTAPESEALPPPGFAEGFADRWWATEQGIKNLIGQGGPGAPGVAEAWRDLIKGTNEQVTELLTNPFSVAAREVQDALDSPSAAYYLGEKSADVAAATPGLVFGGTGAAVARAGILDDLGGPLAADARPGVPHQLVDNPAPTRNIDNPTASPVAADPPPRLGDTPSHHGPPTPEAALNLNDAYVNGLPTTELVRDVADLSTHRVGDADRVVLGKWDGQDGGYIGEARNNGGIYYDTGSEGWGNLVQGLSEQEAKALGWQVNEQFLRTQLENRVPQIEYILPEGFNSVDDVARIRRESFSALEINFLEQNAATYGYQRVGNSWVHKGGE